MYTNYLFEKSEFIIRFSYLLRVAIPGVNSRSANVTIHKCQFFAESTQNALNLNTINTYFSCSRLMKF